MADIDQFADVVVETMREALAEPLARLGQLEARFDGQPSKDTDTTRIQLLQVEVAELRAALYALQSVTRSSEDEAFIQAAVNDAVSKVPTCVGPIGPPGARGEKGEPGPIGPIGLTGPAGVAGEQGPPGTTGIPGKDGERGEPGLIGKAGPAGLSGLQGPRGLDGPMGLPGRDGLPGVQGPAGEKGLNGLDGKDGAPGKDGRDGTLDQLKLERVDERTIRFCGKDGTPIDGGTVYFEGLLLDRGAYAHLKNYEPGDVVSYGGAMWIAQERTSAVPGRPGDAARAWRLSVKAGRDGKDGKPGPGGPAGPKGEKGDPGGVYR